MLAYVLAFKPCSEVTAILSSGAILWLRMRFPFIVGVILRNLLITLYRIALKMHILQNAIILHL